jgi:hypothetical protein
MANPTSSEELNELFASIYERLREHEKMSIDLLIDVMALKAAMTTEQLASFEREKAKALRESGFLSDQNLQRYDGIIAKFRGTR